MTRGPKREIIRLTNERDFPHLVELALPPEGFRSILLEIDAFHRDRRIPVRRGRNRHEVKQVYIRFCFRERPRRRRAAGRIAISNASRNVSPLSPARSGALTTLSYSPRSEIEPVPGKSGIS